MMTTNNNSVPPPPTRDGTRTTTSGSSVSGAAPPPPRRAATNATTAAAASTTASGSSGRTPVAHRTRYMNYQAKRPASVAAAAATTRPPPRRTMPPPPTRSAVDSNENNDDAAANNADEDVFPPPLRNSKFQTSTTTDLQLQADDGIAKRRAELRRLQQSRGAKSNAASAAATARYRLGGTGSIGAGIVTSSSTVSGSRQTMIPPPIAVAAAQKGKKTLTTSTPAICSSPELPSTATITRRLDYDGCVDDHDPNNGNSNPATVDPAALSSSTASLSSSYIPHPPQQQLPPPPQSQPTKLVTGGMSTGINLVENDHDNNNATGQWKRTSEIFNVGKQHQQLQKQQDDQTALLTGTNVISSGSLTTRMMFNPFSPTGPDRTNSTITTATTSAATNAANYRPPVPIDSSSGIANDNDAPVPPLMMEPPTFQHEQPPPQQEQQQRQPVPVPPAAHHQDDVGMMKKQRILPSIIKKSSPMTVLVENEKRMVVQQQQQQDSSSGKSTPVMSNIDHHHHEHEDRGDPLPMKTLKVGTVDHDNNEGSSKSMNNDNGVDVSRLMDILERNEQEKKAALEKLTKMKMLLRLQQEQKAADAKPNSNPGIENNNSSSALVLLDQLKEMVAAHGESAAGTWIAEQLENSVSHSERGKIVMGGGNGGRVPSSHPSSGSGGGGSGGTSLRGDDNDMLLSSIIPPLTPRSRSGSRAASPERGGGLGGLIDNQDDVLGGMGGSSRGKRMTTPLPKKFNKTMVGVSSGGSSTDCDSGGEGEGTGRSSGNQNSLVHESIENEYLVKAAMSIPNEYGTLLASYLVRRPYVYGMHEHNHRIDTSRDDMWSSYAHLSPGEEYQRSATALDPTSIDIVAYIEADGSAFTLTGKCNARHGKLSSDIAASAPSGDIFDERSYQRDAAAFNWVVFDDVEGTDRALGKVTYIDAEGNERDYWLDSIYEEALTTRESYCMSMLSTAYALKEVTGGRSFMMSSTQENNHQRVQTTALHANESINVSAENSSCFQHQPDNLAPGPVDQKDHATQAPRQPATVVNANQAVPPESSKARQPALLEKHSNYEASESPVVIAATSDVKQFLPESTSTAPPTKDDMQAKQTKMQPEEIYEPVDSALPFLVVSILSTLLTMIWFFVKIPLRIGSVVLSVWLWAVALRVLWLLLADDNGAWEMGAGVDFEYNMPGIY